MPLTFVLVHGGQQGAWAWDRLIPELRARNHDALAVELPASDETAGAARYADVVERAIAGFDDEIALVGHSLGGLTIPLVAARRPIEHLIFVCAAYPEPGRSHFEVRAGQPGEGVTPGPSSAWEQPGDAHMLPPDLARELYFNDCPPEVQDWAISRMRPQARLPLREVTPLRSWPATPRTLIIAADDRCIPRESAVRTAQRLFGVAPIELPGGHCLALSQPTRLADVLVAAVRRPRE
jgi:pimeloyl-ACP methyl ester carboxylesterase